MKQLSNTAAVCSCSEKSPGTELELKLNTIGDGNVVCFG